MPKLVPRRHGIYIGRCPRALGPTVVPSSVPLTSCDWSCPGECKEFYEGLARLKDICAARKYENFVFLIRELECKLAHSYWSPLQYDFIRFGLTEGESFFLREILGTTPYWNIKEFHGISNLPVVDYILGQIRTEEHESDAMEALYYVGILDRLRRSIPDGHDVHVCDMLGLFHRRYTEAFGTPYRRGWILEELVHGDLT